MTFRLYPRSVPPAFRQLVADRYPGLNRHPVYWRLMSHLLFYPCLREEHEYDYRILMTWSMVAEIVGTDRRNVNARDWLELFEAEV